MTNRNFQVALSELIRLAFPPGISPLAPKWRDQPVAWVVVAGPGLTPQAGDCVLCSDWPSAAVAQAWATAGVAALVCTATHLPKTLLALTANVIPILTLPPETLLRDVQQAAVQLLINRQGYLVERGTRVYQTLAHQSLEGAGLNGLARAMFELTGKTILIQDKRLHSLAVAVSPSLSEGGGLVMDLLGAWHHLPEGLRDRRQAATLTGWRAQSLPGGLTRLISPIVAKGMARGFLSLLGNSEELDALDQLVVEHGAAACALEMAKVKAVSDAEKRARGDFLDAILTGSVSSEEMARWAQRIGYDTEPPHVALVWRWDERGNAPTLRRLETIINQSVTKQGANALVRSREKEMVIFCTVPSADSVNTAPHPDPALALAESIRKAAFDEYPQHSLRCGIGRPALELADWKDSYREALQAFSMAVRLREARPLYFGDLSVYRLLFRLEGDPELAAFCREALGPLLDYSGGGDLLETLEAFCERLGNLSQTAEKLFIHRNSLLYRMERISQIAGIDMNNPDTRLAVHLALKVRKMINR